MPSDRRPRKARHQLGHQHQSASAGRGCDGQSKGRLGVAGDGRHSGQTEKRQSGHDGAERHEAGEPRRFVIVAGFMRTEVVIAVREEIVVTA